MLTGVHIGGADKETVGELREVIDMIISSQNAERVKIAALEALTALAKAPTHTTMTHCNIDGSQTHNYPAEDSDLPDELDPVDDPDRRD